nr:hypothetical protein [Candidatus Sigynarchaeota archaeon]
MEAKTFLTPEDILNGKVNPNEIQFKLVIVCGDIRKLSLAMNMMDKAGWKVTHCWAGSTINSSAMLFERVSQ